VKFSSPISARLRSSGGCSISRTTPNASCTKAASSGWRLSKAIEDCLAQIKDAGHIASERDLAGVGFKTVIAKGVSGCVRLDERVLGAMEAYNGLAPAHNPPYITGIRLFGKRMPGVPLVGLFETAFYQFAPEAMMRYAVPQPGTTSASAAGASWQPQVHRRTLSGIARAQ
jgi:acetate kinase